jgi:serine-type D-Ala-D-Ala endopeptidase (penicillin-binding protein 7)
MAMPRFLALASLFLGISAVAASSSWAGKGEAKRKPQPAAKKGAIKKRNPPPVPVFTKAGLPNIQSAAAIIIDLDTGAELYAKNADEIRPIASVGKIFLALAVRGKGLPLQGQTTMREEDAELARGGSRSRLPVGKAFTNHDLLRAMLISSDNRACTALGRAAGMTVAQLVAAMNAQARALGLKKTRFDNPSGLRGNVSTAREIVVALRAALADPVLAEILATPQALVRSVGPAPVQVEYFATTVPLRLEKRFPVLGGKTGYTDAARYCLAIAARIDGRRVGMVFLGAEGKLTRFADFNRGAAWLLAKASTKAPEVTATR